MHRHWREARSLGSMVMMRASLARGPGYYLGAMAGPWPTNPAVYEINTWVWLNALSRAAGRRVGLGDVPDEEIARIADHRFDAVWLMGVWERSPGARGVARAVRGLQ